MKTSTGFTLIELIIVIAVLGILSIIAVPRFVNMTTDATVAQLESLAGSLESGANVVRSLAIIRGIQDERAVTLEINGGNVGLHNGFPNVADSCDDFVAGLPFWMNIELPDCSSGSDSTWIGMADSTNFYFIPSPFSTIAENCYVKYVESSVKVNGVFESKGEVDVIVESSGC